MKPTRDSTDLCVPPEVADAAVRGLVKGYRPGRIARSGTNGPGLGDTTASYAPREVPFGPSGLTLYASDVAYLAKLRSGRAATPDTPEGE